MPQHPRCRISKVRFKKHPNLSVLPVDRPMGVGEDLEAVARRMAADPDWASMAGWVIVCWDEEGTARAASYDLDNAVVPLMALPTFVAETVRRDIIYEGIE